LRILHLHSSFNPGGKELRAARLINALGRGVEHAIVSGEPGALGAAFAIDPGIAVSYPDDFPSLVGKPLPGRLQRLAAVMKGFDLVLTYNWGAMDAAMAHTLFRDLQALPPLVHHEGGLNEDEADRRKRSRNLFRRIALGRSSALIVPSRQLEEIAHAEWHQPEGRVVRIASGIDTAAYSRRPKPDALPRVIKRPGEKWLGTLAGLRKAKNLTRLVRVFAALSGEWQLVILGEGPERDAIRAEALRLGIAHRVHLPGFVAEPARAIGLFDLFALTSDSEQFPTSVIEAMAAGLAVAATDVGDVAAMLADANRSYLTPVGNEAAFAAALVELSRNEALRRGIGEANRGRARSEYDEVPMVAAYRAVYAQALGLAQFP
jgi:glycosyltransferase involved in cell wall biosynthesis